MENADHSENKAYAAICKELYASTYASYDAVGAAQDGEDPDSEDSSLWSHPCILIQWSGIWAHIDRIGFRVPDAVAELTEGNDDSGPKAKFYLKALPTNQKRAKDVDSAITYAAFRLLPKQMYSGGEAFCHATIQCFVIPNKGKKS